MIRTNKDIVLKYATNEVAKKPALKTPIVEAEHGPDYLTQQAANTSGNLKKITFELKNEHETENKAVNLFDAYGMYAEVNTFVQDASIKVEPSDFLYNGFKESLKTGHKVLCYRIDLTISAPTNDASQFNNFMIPYTHSVDVRQSRQLTPIRPSADPYSQQPNVKILRNLQLEINASFSLYWLLKPQTTVLAEFYVTVIE